MTRFTPSGMNIQPWKVKVITDNATKEKLLPLVRNQPQIKTCSHLLVFCANTDFETHAAMLIESMIAAGVPGENIKAIEGGIRLY